MDISLYYSEFIAVAIVLIYVIAIVSAIESIINVRTAQGTIAWVISLITFPYLAVPLYLVFGRSKFDGYLDQKDEIEAETAEQLENTQDNVEEYIIPRTDNLPLYKSLFKLVRVPATSSNSAELLIDGEATFTSIEAGLHAAEHYILFEFYIVRDDDLGTRLCQILCNKARAGVKVYFIYDEIGSRPFPRSQLYKQLQQAGVHIAAFNTTQGRRNRFQLNFRNHRKIVVVDGKAAWIGGHNVGDEYLGKNKRIGHWRDTHVKLEGPAVLGAELSFSTDWRWATRTALDINWDLTGQAMGSCNVMVFPSDPASEFEEVGLMYHQVIAYSRRRIWIASPYFVPDRGIVAALQLAALRGVDVRVMIPDQPDGPVVGMANWSFTRELLPAGVKVYRYQDGFMHQKVFLMDDELAGVGTANFDNRSFRLNFEITLLIHDETFSESIETMLANDFSRSHLVTQQDIDNKPFWFPLAMGAARLMSPVL